MQDDHQLSRDAAERFAAKHGALARSECPHVYYLDADSPDQALEEAAREFTDEGFDTAESFVSAVQSVIAEAPQVCPVCERNLG